MVMSFSPIVNQVQVIVTCITLCSPRSRQEFELWKMLHCSKCIRAGKLHPMTYKWPLKHVHDVGDDVIKDPCASFSLVVDVSHVRPGVPPSWSAGDAERITYVHFTVRRLPLSQSLVWKICKDVQAVGALSYPWYTFILLCYLYPLIL
jgi:hypothetical protein